MNRVVRSGLIALSLLFLSLTAFAQEWVYPDTPEKTVLSIADDGTYLFEEHVYTLKAGETFSYLEPEDTSLPALRCMIGDDAIIIYRQNEYARHPQDTGAGLPGAWLSTTGGSIFILGGDGLFMEDGVFTGKYTVDEQAQSFCLSYDGDFAETVCFYSFKDKNLIIEYPWKLIPKGA